MSGRELVKEEVRQGGSESEGVRELVKEGEGEICPKTIRGYHKVWEHETGLISLHVMCLSLTMIL